MAVIIKKAEAKVVKEGGKWWPNQKTLAPCHYIRSGSCFLKLFFPTKIGICLTHGWEHYIAIPKAKSSRAGILSCHT
jgi:hypothetical protein